MPTDQDITKKFIVSPTPYRTFRIYCSELVPLYGARAFLKNRSIWKGQDFRSKHLIGYEFSHCDIKDVQNFLRDYYLMTEVTDREEIMILWGELETYSEFG